ncbi:MAG: hypothetical protein ACO22J_06000 [Burkholderiaceae bacterium]
MPDTHRRPIAERIDWLMDLARRHSDAFCSPEATLARERYLGQHKTAIAVLKCMDGRINIPVATNTPAGLLMPFRNLGGMFDLGWPHLGEVLQHHVLRMTAQGRRVLLLITYHYSKGDPKRGCAGFHYNQQAALDHTWQIRAQVERIFGRAHESVYPLVCGFETDEDAMTIHGAPGLDGSSQTLSLADGAHWTGQELQDRLANLLPDMPKAMQADLLPLLMGNLTHIAEVRAQNARHERLLDIEHREWMICLGRGFDWLHTPNLALIVGPYSPDLSHPIETAATIIAQNMQAGRIPDDGFLLLASVPYEELGVDRARAELKAEFLSNFAAQVIRSKQPDLAAKMHVKTAVLDWRSRRLESF